MLRSATVVPVLVVAAVSIVAGCGINQGFVHDATSGDQHQYRMDLSGVRYMRSVSGSASIGYIFCLPSIEGIPLDRGLWKQAMEALQEEAKLQPNEVLKDLRQDDDRTCYLGVYGVHGLVLSADVYDLTPAGAPGGCHTVRATDSTPAVPARPAGKLTYAQLQEAFAQVQAVRGEGSASHHDVAVRVLGGEPHKTDAESDYWWGNLPGKPDCFVLRLSATKGDSLDTAPNDKCR